MSTPLTDLLAFMLGVLVGLYGERWWRRAVRRLRKWFSTGGK